MSKENNILKLSLYLFIISLLLTVYSLLYPRESVPLYLVLLITSLVFLLLFFLHRQNRINSMWERIMRVACLNINYTSSVFGIKKASGAIVQELCRLPGVEAGWILNKEADGFFRVQVSRGGVSHSEAGIKNIHTYLNIPETPEIEPFFSNSPPAAARMIRDNLSIIHIPICEGERITGLLSVAALGKKYIQRSGVNRFKTIAGVIEQLYENASRKKELEYMAVKIKSQVDSASDEITKTNLRLINRVKEMKSLYNLSVRVFTAKDEEAAAEEVFKQARDILMADDVLYFHLEDERFLLKYSSNNQIDRNSGLSLPLCFLTHNRGVIISDVEDVEELFKPARMLGIAQFMAAPAKVGNRISGLLLAGSAKPDSFNSGDLSMLTIYAGRLAEYLDRKKLTDKIIRDNARLSDLNEIKDKYLALISLELRAPLKVIKGSADKLCSGSTEDMTPEQLGFVNDIREASDKLHKLIDGVITPAD